MLKCKKCGHVQKQENKFHCIKCNSTKVAWLNQNLNDVIKDIVLTQSKMYKETK